MIEPVEHEAKSVSEPAERETNEENKEKDNDDKFVRKPAVQATNEENAENENENSLE